MRSTLDLRLSLNEDEFQQIAVTAFRAGKPVNQWIKEQILGIAQAEPKSPEPAVAAVPAAPAQAPEPLGDRLVHVREDAVRAAHAGHIPEPMTPPAPVENKPPPAQTAVGTQLRFPTGVVSDNRRGPKPSPAVDELTPKGFEAVVSLGEKIVDYQQQARRIAKSAKGVRYNRTIGDFYFKLGIADLPTGIRYQLSKIGERAAEFRRWYQLVPPGTVPENVRPFALMRIFEQNPVPRQSGRPNSTLHFSRHGIKNVPIEEAMGNPGPLVAAEAKPATAPEPPKFDSFAEVEFEKLSDDDRRSLRRFTESIFNMGGPRDRPQADIALAIRKIRGKDNSDTPQIARDLVRLGVISGGSGDYRIRHEYADRFSDVVVWGKAPEEVS